jgi:hypothetical protein
VNAVVLNVTAVNPTASGYLTVTSGYPQSPLPTLYYSVGQTVPNLVIVSTYIYGDINISASVGSNTDVVVDVVGWFVGP